MKMIKQGAEAKLFLSKLNGQKVVIKDRIEKKYRIKQIDEKIRKKRTSLESRLLSRARRLKVPTPKIFEINKKENKIIMEFIDGEIIKNVLNKLDKKTVETFCFQIGRLIGKLHSAGIIHGDLTTSNMILKDKTIYFIDFGLGFYSNKIEDQGTDLRLLHESLKSTHFKILDLCWDNIIKGYKKEYSKAVKVLKRMVKIQKRARYMKR